MSWVGLVKVRVELIEIEVKGWVELRLIELGLAVSRVKVGRLKLELGLVQLELSWIQVRIKDGVRVRRLRLSWVGEVGLN